MYIQQDSMKRKRKRSMEAHKYEEQEQQNTTMEEKEEKQQMSNAHMLSTKKWPMDLNYKTKQVVCNCCGRPRRHKRKRAIVDDVFYDDSKANPYVMNKAKEVQANLDAKFPTFVKFMIRSNVNVGFLLTFPRSFSEMHMPRHDATVILVDGSDEEEEEYQAKYLVGKNSLSAGWRTFSNAHKLNIGDALVFQLIKHCTFKVYIVRTNELDEVDGALALLYLKADTRTCNSDNYTGTHQMDREEHLKPLQPDNIEENI